MYLLFHLDLGHFECRKLILNTSFWNNSVMKFISQGNIIFVPLKMHYFRWCGSWCHAGFFSRLNLLLPNTAQAQHSLSRCNYDLYGFYTRDLKCTLNLNLGTNSFNFWEFSATILSGILTSIKNGQDCQKIHIS